MVPILVAFCFLPLLFWILYAFRVRLMGLSVLFAGFFAGLAAVLVALVPITLVPLLPSPFLAIFAGALAEELAKLVAVLLVARAFRFGSRRRPVFALAVLVGLSFASFENIIYAIRVPLSLPMRFLYSVPLHASLALCSANALALGRDRRSSGSWGWFLLALALHAAYNAGIIVLGSSSPMYLVVIVSVWIAVSLWRRSASEPEEA